MNAALSSYHSRAILLLDSTVPDPAAFTLSLWPGTEIVHLKPGATLSGLCRHLSGPPISRLDIVAHGAPGAVRLGAERLDTPSLAEDGDGYVALAGRFGPDAQINLWACEAGVGTQGAAFATALARVTGAKVFAATGKLGDPALGGTWDLDLRPAGHAAPEPVAADWPHLLGGTPPVIGATLVDSLKTDVDSDSMADPGDTLTYTAVVSNTGMMDATGVMFALTLNDVTLVPNSINVAPQAIDDAYSVLGGFTLTVPDGGTDLFANDFEYLGDSFSLDSFDAMSVNSGTVAVAADGSFTYTPMAGFSGMDTFTYTITDGTLTDTATVTIDVSDPIWFIDNTAGTSGGTGTSADPFQSIADFNAAAGPNAGDYVHIATGSQAYDGNLILFDDMFVIGEGSTVDFATATGLTFPMGVMQPATGGTAPVLTNTGGDGITLAENNTIRGLDIGTIQASSVAIEDDGGTVGTLSIRDMTINTGTGGGIEIDAGGNLDVIIDSLTVAAPGFASLGVELSGAAAEIQGSFAVNGGSIVTGPTAVAVNHAGANPLDFTLDGLTNVRSTAVDGISIGNAANMGVGVNVALDVDSVQGETTAITMTDALGPGFDITVTEFDIDTVASDGTDGGILFNGVTFDADPNMAMIQPVNAGALAIGTTAMRVQGDGLSLNNVTGTFTFSDLDIANNNGTGLGVQNSKANSFTLNVDSGGASNATVNTTNGTAIDLDPLTLATVFSSVTATGGTNGILLSDFGGSFTVSGATSITGTTGFGIGMTGTNTGSATFNGNVTIDNDGAGITGGGIDLDSGTLSFTSGLDIDTLSGPGIDTDGGTLGVSATGGTESVNTATGPIVDLSGTAIGVGGASFDTLASSGTVAASAIRLQNISGGTFSGGNASVADTSSGDGINIAGGTAPVTFESATIDGAASDGIEVTTRTGSVTFTTVDIDGSAARGIFVSDVTTFNVNGGNIGATTTNAGGVRITNQNNAGNSATIAANITNSSGDAVFVTGQNGGTTTISGNISNTGAGTGIDISNNTSGTVTLSGGTKTVNTGTNTAVDLQNNSSATINFTGGGLDIDTTTGRGFYAKTGGTVNVTGTGNSILSTTGTALTIDGVTIGASDVAFQSVGSTGATNGILLNNTGTSGGLTITGGGNTTQGGDNSGGTIQNTTGSGIKLTNTQDVSLTNVRVLNSLLHGIEGSGVTNFDLINSRISGSGNAANEYGVEITNLRGPGNTIQGSVVETSFEDNVLIVNTTGNATQDVLTVTGSRFANVDTGTQEAGILVRANAATANLALHVVGGATGNTFAGNPTAGIVANADGGALDLIVSGINNTITGSFRGISGSSSAALPNSDLDFLIDGATITQTGNAGVGPAGIAFAAFNGGGGIGSINGIIQNSYIYDAISNSYIAAISLTNEGSGASVVGVYNNTIDIENNFGVLANAQGTGSGSFDVTVRNNTIDTQVAGPTYSYGTPLRFYNGSTMGSQTITIDVAANTLYNDTVGYADTVIGKFNAGGTFRVEQLPGASSPDNTVPDFTPDTASHPTELAITGAQTTSAGGTLAIGSGGFVNATATAPTLLMLPPPLMAAGAAPEGEPDEAPRLAADDAALVPRLVQGGGDAGPRAAGVVFVEPARAAAPEAEAALELTQGTLGDIVQAAKIRWLATGLSDDQAAALAEVEVVIDDLGGLSLASATGPVITVDRDAAGNGWFVDPTPLRDDEFETAIAPTRYFDTDGPASDAMDLLTTVMHEIGHTLGLGDLAGAEDSADLMASMAFLGERRLPAQGQAEGAAPGSVDGTAFIGAPINLGTLPAGESATIVFDATVDAQMNQNAVDPSQQATVSGSNFANVLTDDPDQGGMTDPTVTAIDRLSLEGDVFHDVNGNGVFEPGMGEMGIGGVVVKLYADDGTTAGAFDASDTELAMFTTSLNPATLGHYDFNSPVPGDYIVAIDPAEFGSGATLEILSDSPITTPEPPDPDNNVENDDNGAKTLGTIATLPITLNYNSEPSENVGPLPNTDTNTSLDIGVLDAPPALLSFTRQTPLTSPTNSDVLVFRAIFSEGVVNVSDADFDPTGTTAAVTGVNMVNSMTYDLTVSGGDLAGFNGVVGMNLGGSQNIEDANGNPLPNTEPPVDETYTVDNLSPMATSFTRKTPPDATTDADAVTFLATFNEGVMGVTTGSFALSGSLAGTSSITGVAMVTPATWDVMVDVPDNDPTAGTINLDFSAMPAISDLAGNALAIAEPPTDQTYTIDNNDPPVAEDDDFVTGETGVLMGDVQADNGNGPDTDPDGDMTTVTEVNGAGGNVGGQIVLPSGALLTMMADGTFDYDPNGAFVLGLGETDTDSFTYTLSDGMETDGATVTITIQGENGPPMAVADAAMAMEDGPAFFIDLTSNDLDPDPNDNLEIASLDLTGTLGTVSIDPDGDLVLYDPAGMFEELAAGETAEDVFSYTNTDGNGGSDTATVTVTVKGQNDPPMAVDDSAGTDPAGAIVVDVLANDVDPDASDVLTLQALDTSLAQGAASIVPGGISYDPTGAFPGLAPGATAMDVISYEISDGNGGTDTAKLTVLVTAPDGGGGGGNAAPFAADDAAMTGSAGPAIQIALLANDLDPDGDPLTVTGIGTGTTQGSAVLGAGGVLNYNPAGAFAGLFQGQTAIDEVTYTISDGNGGTAMATARITVKGAGLPPNQPPVARDDAFAILFGLIPLGNLFDDNGMGADSDPDGDPLILQAINGEASNVGAPTVLPSGALLSATASGDFFYDPNSAFGDLKPGEATTDSFVYTLSDGKGGSDTAVATFEVAVPDFLVLPGADGSDPGDNTFVVDGLNIPLIVDGGDGDDSVELPGNVDDFIVVPIDGGFEFRPLAGGQPVQVLDVEEIQFADATLFVDTSLETQSVYFVYQVFLDRDADPFGLAFWKAVLESGFTLDEVADFFPPSPEFETMFGDDLTNKEYVQVLYQNGFDRDADQVGCDFWTGLLDEGVLDRGDVGLFFAQSDEIRMVFENAVDDGLLVAG